MNRATFHADLAAELRLRNVPFKGRELYAFVGSVWAWAKDDPSVGRWANAFVARQDEAAEPALVNSR